mgnify:CR=1 FL=1
MKELNQFVEQENRWAGLFGYAPLSLEIATDRQKIADKIDARLSPENLTCDGELSRAEVDRKYRFLRRVAAQLILLDPSVQFYEFN